MFAVVCVCLLLLLLLLLSKKKEKKEKSKATTASAQLSNTREEKKREHTEFQHEFTAKNESITDPLQFFTKMSKEWEIRCMEKNTTTANDWRTEVQKSFC
jgi:hypothetical protein